MKRIVAKSAVEPSRLTPEAIVTEAIALLGEEGLEAVSLRRLAARLGVRAPSLYWHMPDKATLLSAMMERIFCECLDTVPLRRHWQDWMRAFATALWVTQDGMADFSRLLISAPLDEERISRIETRLRSRLADLDLDTTEALRIQGSIQVLVTGWSMFAHSHFSPALARRMDFRDRALHDVEMLLEGEARRLQSSGATTV